MIDFMPTTIDSNVTVQVRNGLEKRSARIVPEMGLRVSFKADARKPVAGAVAVPVDMVLAPASAAVKCGDHGHVIEIDEGRARARVVNLGPLRRALQAVSGATDDASVVRFPLVRFRSAENVITEEMLLREVHPRRWARQRRGATLAR